MPKRRNVVYVVQNIYKPEQISVWQDVERAVSIAAFGADDSRTQQDIIGWLTRHPYKTEVGQYRITAQTILN